ncbi:MAG: aspartyl protease family protein [Chloracidobacterium sp.]|nr:aspartyl protease family protein [Chloracidobacterium sp.]
MFLLLIFFALLLAPVITEASTVSTNNSDEVRGLIKKAAKLTRNGQLIDAESLLRRAVSLDPEDNDAKVELAYVLVKRRKLLDAYNTCLPVVEREPNNSRAFAVMGATLLYAGRFLDSRGFFTNAIRINKKEHLAWAGLGMLNFYENNIDDSRNHLLKALDLKPDEPDYLFACAQTAGRGERFKEAADHYARFLLVSNDVDKDRRDRIRGLINFLRILGLKGKLYTTEGRDQTSVPFEMENDRPIINLRINDKSEPLRFVLDTGSGISVVSDTTAKRLGISPITKGGYAKGIGGDGKFEIVYGLVRKVSIGDISIKNVPVYLRKFQDQTQRVDGYIGLALISKFLTTIDYGNNTFALTKRPDDKQEFQKSEEVSLPLRLTSSGFLSGEVQLQGIDSLLNFIVDTGASLSVISERVANHDGILPFANDEKMRVIGSAGIRDDVSSFLLPRVTFGKHSRTSIKAVALDLDLINESTGFEQAGILGGNFLKNYRLTFDFINSKVVFEPIRSEN